MSGIGADGTLILTNNETPEEANKFIGEYNKANGTNFGWAKPAEGETDLTNNGAKIRDADVVQNSDGSWGIGQVYNSGVASLGRSPELAANEGPRFDVDKDGKINVFGTDNFIKSDSFKQFKNYIDNNVAGKVDFAPQNVDKLREMFNATTKNYEQEAQYNMAIQKEVNRLNSERGLDLTADKYKDSLDFANKLKDENIKDDDEIEFGNLKKKKSDWKQIFKKENVGNDEALRQLSNVFSNKNIIINSKDKNTDQLKEQAKNITEALDKMNPEDVKKFAGDVDADGKTVYLKGFAQGVNNQERERIVNELRDKLKESGKNPDDFINLANDKDIETNKTLLEAARGTLEKEGLWNDGGFFTKAGMVGRNMLDSFDRMSIASQVAKGAGNLIGDTAGRAIVGMLGGKVDEDSWNKFKQREGLVDKSDADKFAERFYSGKDTLMNIGTIGGNLAGGIAGVIGDARLFASIGKGVSAAGRGLQVAGNAEKIGKLANMADKLEMAGASPKVINGITNLGVKAMGATNTIGKGIEFTGNVMSGTNKIKDIGTFSNHTGKVIDATKNVVGAEKIAGATAKAAEFGKTPLGQLAKIPVYIAEDAITEIPRANIINKLHEMQTGKKNDNYSYFASDLDKYAEQMGQAFSFNNRNIIENIIGLGNLAPILRGGGKALEATKAWEKASDATRQAYNKVKLKIDETDWKQKRDVKARGTAVQQADMAMTKTLAEGLKEGDELHTMAQKAQLDSNNLRGAVTNDLEQAFKKNNVINPLENFAEKAQKAGYNILTGKDMEIKDLNGKKIGVKFLDNDAIEELGKISEYKQLKGQIENKAKNGEKVSTSEMNKFHDLQDSVNSIKNYEAKAELVDTFHEAFRGATKAFEDLGVRPKGFLDTIDANGNFKGYMSKGYIDLDTGKYIENNNTSLSTGKMNHNAKGGEPTDTNLVKLDPASAYMQLLNSAVRHMELEKVRAMSDLLKDMDTVGVKNIDVANEKYNPLRPNATYREINPDKAGKYRDNNVSAKLDDEDISNVRHDVDLATKEYNMQDPANIMATMTLAQDLFANKYVNRRMEQGFSAKTAYDEMANNPDLIDQMASETLRSISVKNAPKEAVKLADDMNKMFDVEMPKHMNAVQNQYVEAMNLANKTGDKADMKKALNLKDRIENFKTEELIKKGRVDIRNQGVMTRNVREYAKLDTAVRDLDTSLNKVQKLQDDIANELDNYHEITNVRLGVARDIGEILRTGELSAKENLKVMKQLSETIFDGKLPETVKNMFNDSNELKAGMEHIISHTLIEETRKSLELRHKQLVEVAKNNDEVIAKTQKELDSATAKRDKKLEAVKKSIEAKGVKADDYKSQLDNIDKSIEKFQSELEQNIGKWSGEDLITHQNEIEQLYRHRNDVLKEARKDIQKTKRLVREHGDTIINAYKETETLENLKKTIQSETKDRAEFYDLLGDEKANKHEEVRQARQDIEGEAFNDDIDKVRAGSSEYTTDDPATKAILRKYLNETYNKQELEGFKKYAWGVANTISSWFRFNTTSMPPIAAARNAVRDSIHSTIMSGGESYGVLEGLINAFKGRSGVRGGVFNGDMLKNPEAMTAKLMEVFGVDYETARRGALQLGSIADDTFFHQFGSHSGFLNNKTMEKLTKGKVKQVLDLGYEGLTKMNDSVEKISRFANTAAGLNRAVDKGLDFDAAMAKAEFLGRNTTTDFRAMRTNLQSLSRGTSYLNATFSGSRSLRLMIQQDPLGVATKIMMYAVAPALTILNNNLKDENRDTYNNIPDYVKESNIVIVFGKGKVAFLPLPQELQGLFGTVEGIASGRYKNSQDYLGGLLKAATPFITIDFSPVMDMRFDKNNPFDEILRTAGRIGSSVVPDVGKSVYEMATGKSLYFGNDTYQGIGKVLEKKLGIDTKTKEGDLLSRRLYSGGKMLLGTNFDNILNFLSGIIDPNAAPEDKGGYSIGQQFKRTFARDIGADGEKGAKYDYVNSMYRDTISDLEQRKEKVLEQLEIKDKEIREAKKKGLGEDTINELTKEREEISNKFGSEVEEKLRNYMNQFAGNKYFVWDNKKEKQLINLMLPKNQALLDSDEDLDEAEKTAYYSARDKAVKRYLGMNLPEKPTADFLYDNAKNDLQGSYYKMLGQVKDLKKQKIEGSNQTLKQKFQEYQNKIQEIYNRKSKLGKAEYAEIDKLKKEYMENYFSPMVLSLTEEYTPYLVLNNKNVIRELGDIVMVPNDWQKDNKGKQAYGNKRLDETAGYAQSYIQHITGTDKDTRKLQSFGADQAAVRAVDRMERMKNSGDISGARALKKRFDMQVGNGMFLLDKEQSERLRNLKI
jgi:hypothetical protein